VLSRRALRVMPYPAEGPAFFNPSLSYPLHSFLSKIITPFPLVSPLMFSVPTERVLRSPLFCCPRCPFFIPYRPFVKLCLVHPRLADGFLHVAPPTDCSGILRSCASRTLRNVLRPKGLFSVSRVQGPASLWETHRTHPGEGPSMTFSVCRSSG